MDSVDELRRALDQVFEEWTLFPGPESDFQIVSVMDRERDRYLLLHQGWDGYRRVDNLLAQVDVIDGKLWVQEDRTENGIANDLIAAGVPKGRIVLGFKHPSRRKHTEFAVA